MGASTRGAWVVLGLLGLPAGCAKRVETTAPPHRLVVQLLPATPEVETARNGRLAVTLTAEGDQERTPRVVAQGESPLVPAQGVDLRLYGDAQASRGIFVDNGLLLEVLAEDGRRLGRVAVGLFDGLSEGRELIDLAGRRAFRFEPGEVSLTGLLPERGLVRVRATALDVGGVGSVSDVYLVVEPRAAEAGDELSGR